MIAIIDYGMGNLRSVQKAFEQVGAEAVLIANPTDLATYQVDRLVLPGVGAFGDGMDNLKKGGWIPVIKSWINSGKPFLGICLGMQLLFEGSEEDASGDGRLVAGMGVLQGRVERFKPLAGERIKVPHMGWNCVRSTRKGEPLFAGLEGEVWAYFVHGYYVVPPEPPAGWGRGDSIVSGWSEYPAARPFCAVIRRANIWATQFHPEKSQRAGLQMFANFAGTKVPADVSA